MTKKLLRAMLALAILAAAPVASAVPWGAILLNGPAEDFHDEDIRLLMDAIRTTLEAPGEPKPVEWSNVDSRAGGSLLVIGRPKVEGFDECRRVRMTLYSRRQKGYPSVFTACREMEPGGRRWLLVAAG